MQEVGPPHDVAAEMGVLAGIIYDNTGLDRIDLQPDDFYIQKNAIIFQAMLDLAGGPVSIDAIGLYDKTRGTGVSAEYLSMIEDDHAWTAARLKGHASIVKKFALKRAAATGLGRCLAQALNGSNPAELRANIEAVAEELTIPAAVPVTLSMAELLTATEAAQEWTVGNLLPAGGLSLIAGKPGAGKSTLARDMALAVAQGKPWLGREVKQGPVLYLALEEHPRMIGTHMRSMGASAADPLYVRVDPLDDPIAELGAMVKELQPVRRGD